MNLDKLIHQFVASLNNIEWRKTEIDKLWYYYAEDQLYIIYDGRTGHECYGFVHGRSPKAALDNYLKWNK